MSKIFKGIKRAITWKNAFAVAGLFGITVQVDPSQQAPIVGALLMAWRHFDTRSEGK